ncbi:MAG: BatD family protein [Bacteroidota bacterium]|nr:BatD family protein [Bacteroidota bacterium]
MNLKTIKYFLTLICILVFVPIEAATPRFVATASSTTVAAGEQIQITFELQGNGARFQAPTFAGFNVLMGPSQSSNMQIINGNMSQSISFTYVIQALKEGTYKIGAASIEVEGKRVQSNELTITVVKGSQPHSGGQGTQQKPQSNDAGGLGDKSVFIKASVDKANVYRGEAIIVTYKIYTKVSLVNYGLKKMPSLEGFYSQDINTNQQLQFVTENLEGVQYKSAIIKQMVLFPQRSGTLTLDAMEGEVVARVQVKRQQQSNNPFDFFFNDPFFNNSVQDVQVKIKSMPVKINVKELPKGSPDSFKGSVGRFTLNATFDRKEAKAHDALNLKIKISGKGNIKLLDPPHVEFPPDFETYDPKEVSNATATTDGMSGSKTFEYLVIPKNAGDYKVSVNDFSFFDIDKNKYETIKGSDFILKIAKGDETLSTAVTGVSKNEIEYLGKDIRFIKTNIPDFEISEGLFYRSNKFYLYLIIPAILFLVTLILRMRYLKMNSNVNLLKSRRANKVAMRRLSAAKKFLADKKSEAFLDEMFRALWGFISDRLQIPVSQLSKENVSSILNQKHVSEDSVQQFIQTLDTCEMARFARGMAESNEEIYRKGIAIISKLEEEIK